MDEKEKNVLKILREFIADVENNLKTGDSAQVAESGKLASRLWPGTGAQGKEEEE